MVLWIHGVFLEVRLRFSWYWGLHAPEEINGYYINYLIPEHYGTFCFLDSMDNVNVINQNCVIMKDHFWTIYKRPITSLFIFSMAVLGKQFPVELYTKEELMGRKVVRDSAHVTSKPHLLFQNVNLFSYNFQCHHVWFKYSYIGHAFPTIGKVYFLHLRKLAVTIVCTKLKGYALPLSIFSFWILQLKDFLEKNSWGVIFYV